MSATQQSDANEAPSVPNIEQIINSIPQLIRLLSSAKNSVPSSNTAAVTTNTNGGGGAGNNGGDSHSQLEEYKKIHNHMERLEKDLNFIRISFGKLKDLEVNISKQFTTLQKQTLNLNDVVKYIQHQPQMTLPRLHANVKAVTDMVIKLKLQIPSPHQTGLPSEGHRSIIQAVSGLDTRNLIDELLGLHSDKMFQSCLSYKNFEECYNSLDSRSKVCLLCFAVFPEGAVVKKRLLMYWWIGEGLIDRYDCDSDQAYANGQTEEKQEIKAEEVAYNILKGFVEKGLVEPVIKKKRLVGFRMHSLTRYAVISRADKSGFFSFDRNGNPTADFSSCQRACLVKTEEGYSRRVLTKSVSSEKNANSEAERLQLEKLRTLFNVSDPYPDFEMQQMLRMKKLKVLCLGRWDDSSKKQTEDEESKMHIEVESTEFLKGLKNMKYLKYLSLQGVSRINLLPDTIWDLPSLRILDLNACHTLESLPEKIVFLKNLTYLDVSECYLLDYMPMDLGKLTNLQVLKGFVISDIKKRNAGTLDDLEGLPRLRKLSIYTMKKDFPTGEELNALRHIPALRKLTIIWGGKSLDKPGPVKKTATRKYRRLSASSNDQYTGMNPQHPLGLEKLDLQCCPAIKAPTWLMPSELQSLEKLYIRGGNLSNLGHLQDKWKVKILRFKYLSDLRMEWRELRDAFPDLILLEKVSCPKLTLFPCDESGVWVNRKSVSDKKQLGELGYSWSFIANRSF